MLAFASVCVFALPQIALTFHALTTGSTLTCAGASHDSPESCQGNVHFCSAGQACVVNAEGGSTIHYYFSRDFTLLAKDASSLTLSCGTTGAPWGSYGGNYGCSHSYIECPRDGDCIISCGGEQSCINTVVSCPRNGLCQVTCDGTQYAVCKGLKVLAAEGEAPVISKVGSGATSVGEYSRVLCPSGDFFENDDFKPTHDLTCPETTTATTTPAALVPCSAEDSCRGCRDGSITMLNVETGKVVDAGGHCYLSNNECVDIYSFQTCKADGDACPETFVIGVKPEYIEPVWYQECTDSFRRIVQGPGGCRGAPNITYYGACGR